MLSASVPTSREGVLLASYFGCDRCEDPDLFTTQTFCAHSGSSSLFPFLPLSGSVMFLLNFVVIVELGMWV